MFRFSPPWEHPDTKSTLLAMQAKLDVVRDESARHNGDREIFLSALREVVALGTSSLACYAEQDDDLGSPDSQARLDVLTMLGADSRHTEPEPDGQGDWVA
ncbi:hypothetical protein ACYOEI_01920 [Singulisphaera rosea]